MIASTTSRLSELSQIIAKNTVIVERYYIEHELGIPTFEVGGPEDTTIHDQTIERARTTVIAAATELRDLLEGPTMQLRPVLNATSLQSIYKFNVPEKVPVDGEISYHDLAKLCGLEVDVVRRIIRFAIAHHRVFQEKHEGFVSHSAASKLLVDNPNAMACLGFQFDECYPSFAHTVEALQKYDRQSPVHCGWAVAHQSDVPIWEYNSKDLGRRTRISRAMRQFTKGFGHDTISLLTGWDWAKLAEQHPNPLVVDLGGANGHASVLLAQEFPGIRFQVQDLPRVIEAAKDDVPTQLRDRVELKAHDMKETQPTEADVYLIRQVMHNWPDVECVRTLRALIPALKPGARIVINDVLITAPGTVSPMVERHIRSMDMIVMTLNGATEREEMDWRKLFNEADSRFVDINVCQFDNCCLAIIEATWSG